MNKRAAKAAEEEILGLLKDPGYQPSTAAEIATALRMRGKRRKQLPALLHGMVMAGQIVIIRHNRYSLGDPADLVTGRLEIKRSGEGLVVTQEGAALLRLPKGSLGVALPGDTVTARRDAGAGAEAPGRLAAGSITRILERGRRMIVGTLRTTGTFHYVVPIDPAYSQDFYVPDARGAAVNDRVVIQFSNWANRHVNPEAEIVDVIGPADNPSLDTISIIRHHELAEDFPADVLEEAEKAGTLIDEPGRRLDLRDRFIFTIDPERARDFDDALSLETDGAGRRVLGVHIADVAHFVREGTALDREARRRGTSVYFPDKVLPMLPEQLSNAICSLRPDEDRMAFSVFLTLDEHGSVAATQCAKSVIRSRLRLTYEQALAVIEGRAPEHPGVTAEATDSILRLHALAQQLRRRRFLQFALDLEMPECEFVVGPSGLIEGVRVAASDPSHQLIEECMIAANEGVDRELSGRGLQLMHRVHEPPAPEKLAELAEDLERLGYRPGNLGVARNLSAFLASVKDDPLARHVHTAVLRSMKRALYSHEPGGHFGLGKTYYAHFTSPIRRYPDLVVHRILAASISGRRVPYQKGELEPLSVHCSTTEREAEEAERDVMEIKKYRYLEQLARSEQAPVFEAVVVNVTNFGLFVELIDLQLQGLVHVSSISDAFVRFDSAREVLEGEGRTFGVGDSLRVRVTRVDFDNRRIDFVPENRASGRKDSGSGAGPSRGRGRTRDRKGGNRTPATPAAPARRPGTRQQRGRPKRRG